MCHPGPCVLLTDPRTQHFSLLLSLTLPHPECTCPAQTKHLPTSQSSPGPCLGIEFITPRQVLVEHQRKHQSAGRWRRIRSNQRLKSSPFFETDLTHTHSLTQLKDQSAMASQVLGLKYVPPYPPTQNHNSFLILLFKTWCLCVALPIWELTL